MFTIERNRRSGSRRSHAAVGKVSQRIAHACPLRVTTPPQTF
jgi:hypothetical protein